MANPSPFQNWIVAHYRSLFFLLLVATLVTGGRTLKDKYLITTKHAPSGMICLEVTTKNADRDSILNEWDHNYKNILTYDNNTGVASAQKITGIDAAIATNKADYYFIPSYVLLLLLFAVRLTCSVTVPGKGVITPLSIKGAIILGVAIVLAGILDIVEDLGIGRVLDQFCAGTLLSNASAVGVPSLIKWLLVTIITVFLAIQAFKLKKVQLWLEEISEDIKSLLSLFWRFRVVLITLLLLFVFLYVADQGQDLAVTASASGALSRFFFLFTDTVIALVCWHMPKAIENARNLGYGKFWVGPVDFSTRTPGSPNGNVDIARVMGTAAFLIPATGLLQIMHNYHIDYWLSSIPSIGILAAILALYTIALRHSWIQKLYHDGARRMLFYSSLLILLALAVAVFWLPCWFNDGDRLPLTSQSIDLILLSVIFLIVTTMRTCMWAGEQPRRYLLDIRGWKAGPVITVLVVLCTVFFIICNNPGFLHWLIAGKRYFTFPIVFCAIVGYTVFFSWLLFLGKKTGIYFATILLLFTTWRATSTLSEYHNIALVNKTGPKKYKTDTSRQGQSLDSYAEQWMINRETELDTFTKNPRTPYYPVYFVNAHGGGIRAAVWTTMVIGTLDSTLRTCRKTNDGIGFQHYVFSYSGESGGTIGSALLCGADYNYVTNPRQNKVFYPLRIGLYQTDNLTSDIVALMGRDLWMYSFGVPHQYWGIVDRGRLMEEDWEYNTANTQKTKLDVTQKIDFKTCVDTIWREEESCYEIPLLFSNTYDIHDGKKGITAPVKLDSTDFPATILINQVVQRKEHLRLSTAAFLSARFPYVSPTAKLGPHHFTDGGTIENSGGETSLQVIKVFERVRDSLVRHGHPNLSKISINILSLPNEIPGIDSPEPDKNLYEPVGPPLGILKTVNSNAAKAEEINSDLALPPKCYDYKVFRPKPIPVRGGWAVLPLGWQISDNALITMYSSATAYPSTLDTVLLKFGVKRTK